MKREVNEYKDSIDNYADTVMAIVGFLNFYIVDQTTYAARGDVKIFQGRKLLPSAERRVNESGNEVVFVTPDLGILLPSSIGLLGEVKKSLPNDSEHWHDVFEQLLSYDDDLEGWPTETGKVANHEVVLLVHQSRVKKVVRFYQEHKAKYPFERPLTIIEFHRSDERSAYFAFTIEEGALQDTSLNQRMRDSVHVPMARLIDLYSSIKLSDDKPPLPYLCQLIWENLVAAKAIEINAKPLRKDQKVNVTLDILQIVEDLNQGFSFSCIAQGGEDCQPRVPETAWVREACTLMVKNGDARWTDESSRRQVTAIFRLLSDPLEHFIQAAVKHVADEEPHQQSLFVEILEARLDPVATSAALPPAVVPTMGGVGEQVPTISVDASSENSEEAS
jgi:hypothetical protein